MSASITRKAMELFSVDLEKKKKKKKKVVEAIVEEKVVTKKRKQKQKIKAKALTIKGRKTKSAIEQYKQNLAGDQTAKNVYYMQLMSGLGRVNSDVTEKIIGDHERNSRKVKISKKSKEEESTLFTENDFKKFDKEYKFDD